MSPRLKRASSCVLSWTVQYREAAKPATASAATPSVGVATADTASALGQISPVRVRLFSGKFGSGRSLRKLLCRLRSRCCDACPLVSGELRLWLRDVPGLQGNDVASWTNERGAPTEVRESSGALGTPAIVMHACRSARRDRQQVIAGAMASPCWIGVRRRPTRCELSHAQLGLRRRVQPVAASTLRRTCPARC
jgi:hypothetical protein